MNELLPHSSNFNEIPRLISQQKVFFLTKIKLFQQYELFNVIFAIRLNLLMHNIRELLCLNAKGS